MTYDEAMALITPSVLVKRDGWVKQTVRHMFDDEVKRPTLERTNVVGTEFIEPRLPYEPTDEDRAATDWRIAEKGEEPWA